MESAGGGVIAWVVESGEGGVKGFNAGYNDAETKAVPVHSPEIGRRNCY